MNKARKQNYRPGTLKRLLRESLILSSTRFVSSRVVRFFESGILSPMLRSVNEVDRFVRYKVTHPFFEKIELRKRVLMPSRNAFASFLAKSRIMNRFAAMRNAFLAMSLRSIGVFLFTFGIYSTAIFLLKRYIDIGFGTVDTDDLSFSAITVLVGIIFSLFGDKSVLTSLGNGKIIGTMLSGSLGVNETALNRKDVGKPPTAALTGFLLGSLFGVTTLFFSPFTVIYALLALVLVVTVLCVPEFGMLLAVFSLSFLPVGFLSSISLLTLFSYLIKCLRLKRNFRFGTADAVMLLFFLSMFVFMLSSGGTLVDGEIYILGFASLYFVARNTLCTERLIRQSFSSLCNGLCVGMALCIVGAYAHLIPHASFRDATLALTENVMQADMLSMLIVITLPFAFSAGSLLKTKSSELVFLLLIVGCVIVMDSFVLSALVLCAFFVYIAIRHRAYCGSALGALVVLPPLFLVLSDRVASTAVMLFRALPLDASLFFDSTVRYTNFWGALADVGGELSVILFGGAMLLVFQRMFGGAIVYKSEFMRKIGGTVAVSAVWIFLLSFMFNPFADLRMILAICFVQGLCGAVYKVGRTYKSDYRED